VRTSRLLRLPVVVGSCSWLVGFWLSGESRVLWNELILFCRFSVGCRNLVGYLFEAFLDEIDSERHNDAKL
jgi:hypothetical protein